MGDFNVPPSNDHLSPITITLLVIVEPVLQPVQYGGKAGRLHVLFDHSQREIDERVAEQMLWQ